MTVRTILCDDDPIVRTAVTGYLDPAPDLQVVGTAADAESAFTLLEHLAADVVLMDLAMPGLDGVAATATIRTRHPAVAVLVLTTFGTDENVAAALEAGAAGFLLKSSTATAIVAAVRAAAAGAGVVITPQVAARLAHGLAGDRASTATAMPPAPDLPPGARELTARELEVLELLCLAASNARIAADLHLSESTVKKHVASVLGKLGASSRLEAAVRAFELRLAPVPGAGASEDT